jgi:hypothetical protein
MALSSFHVSSRWANALLIPAALVTLAPALLAQDSEDENYLGESTEQYASIRVLEGEATIQKGDVEEPLSRGVPVAEGDVVESHGRGVLQLADGTRVAFGPGTRFQVAALLSGQDRQVLLRLDHGRLRIALGRDSQAQVRVDTPSGSLILADGAGASLELERDRTTRVKMHSGRSVFLNERDRASLVAGERLTVYSPQDRLDRIQDYNTYSGDPFDSWSGRVLDLRRGPSWDRVPAELRYYSDDLDENGEWVYVDEYRTWCWRPLRVSAEWRPYWRGRWGAYPGGMTWISDEPWGYVTYHHGRWGWGAGLGWYWIPGIHYAPAWVAWQSSDAYFGWAPMGYYDRPVSWGFGAWGGGFCWNVVEINFIHTSHLHTHIHDDPGVIRRFNPGSGSTSWSSGGRPLTHPWRQTPVVVSPGEFRDPSRFQRAIQDPGAQRSRLRTYEQQTGRPLQRSPYPGNTPPPATRGPEPFRPATERPRPLDRPRTDSGIRSGNPTILPPPTSSPTPRPGLGSPRPVPREQPIPRPSEEAPKHRGGIEERPTHTPPSGSGAPVLPPPLLKKRPLGRP